MTTSNKRVTATEWTEAEARRLLDECRASGLSIRAFALRHGLRPRRLYWWIKRLAQKPAPATRVGARRERAMKLVPVIVKGIAPQSAVRATIIVRAGKHTTMEIASASGASAAWVAAVMAELERLSCS